MKLFNFICKPVSGVVAIVFTVFTVLTTAPPSAFSDPTPAIESYYSNQLNHLLSNISIPKEIGKIEDSFKGKSDKAVIYIQDAQNKKIEYTWGSL